MYHIIHPKDAPVVLMNHKMDANPAFMNDE